MLRCGSFFSGGTADGASSLSLSAAPPPTEVARSGGFVEAGMPLDDEPYPYMYGLGSKRCSSNQKNDDIIFLVIGIG